MLEAMVSAWLLFVVLALVVGLVIGHLAGWYGGVKYGRKREQVATARAMATIRKHYAVDVACDHCADPNSGHQPKLCTCDGHNVVVGQCAVCGVDCYSMTGHPEPACPTSQYVHVPPDMDALAEKNLKAAKDGLSPDPIKEQVTYPEWCAMRGTTTDEMAKAQELAEEENWGEDHNVPLADPIGRCECGAPIYITQGFCGDCNR